MKVLIIGDIVGECAVDYLRYYLSSICEKYGADVVIANAENASGGNGLSYSDYDTLIDIGVDAVTMGNLTFGRKDIFKILENEKNIVRPINYPEGTVGRGSMIIERKGKKIGIINAMGRVNVMNIDCPFKALERESASLKEKTESNCL